MLHGTVTGTNAARVALGIGPHVNRDLYDRKKCFNKTRLHYEYVGGFL